MNEIGLVVCLHGDEDLGLEVEQEIGKRLPVFVANPAALNKKTRFIDTDMNRCFPGKPDGNYEEMAAFNLLKKIKGFKYVVDIHSSSCDIELFGIITKKNEEKINLAKKMNLKKLIIMNDTLAKGSSLIDNLNCAISIEVGPHKRKKNILDVIQTVNNLELNLNKNCSDFNIDLYEIFDVVSGEGISKYYMKDFKEVKQGELLAEGNKKYYAPFDFIPIFVGEKAYKGILCLAARKISD